MRKTTKLIVLSLILVMLCGIAFVACNDGSDEHALYALKEAYESDFIDKQDLMDIAYYKNIKTEYGPDPNYTPNPKQPESLSKEIEKVIKQTYIDQYTKPEEGIKIDDVTIAAYYGVYNGYVVVSFECRYYNIPAWVPTIEIDGVQIHYYGNPIYLWK